MPRPRLPRSVWFSPCVTYFKPRGIGLSDLEDITLHIDELEAMRLKDLLGMSQSEAAKKMNVSQPTFHRLVLSARKKVADALVNGKALRIEGGNVKMYGRGQGRGRGQGMGFGRRFRGGQGMQGGICVCPKCGHSEPKRTGVPCVSLTCPKCGTKLVRGD